jgi:RNA polymerase sigma-70 factor (ECF subfamily)
MDDEELISGIARGNNSDFELLIKKYQPNVFRTAMALVHSREDAEEITQDVFVKVYRSLENFRGKARFSTWLYRVSLNTALNYLKARKRKHFWSGLSGLFNQQSNEKNAETVLTEKAEASVIRKAIDGLPSKQRLVFILLKYEELPQKEVAQILKISEGAVEQLVIRAKTNLKKELEKTLAGA